MNVLRFSAMLRVGLLGIFLVGCADPLTKTMRQYGYTPAIPAPATLHIGSIYDTADLKDPYALIRDMFLTNDIALMMESLKDSVSIPDSSGGRFFTVTAGADFVGKAKVELESHGITKFKVHFSGVTQYLISKYKFETELYPKIKDKVPGKKLDRKYVIVALLRTTSMEYEFSDTKGLKIDVVPGSALESLCKAKIGAEWSASTSNNLSIDAPRFIGYRMAGLTETGYKRFGGQTVWRGELKGIPAQDLRNAAR